MRIYLCWSGTMTLFPLGVLEWGMKQSLTNLVAPTLLLDSDPMLASAALLLLVSATRLVLSRSIDPSAVLAAVNEESADFSSFWRTLEGKSAYSQSALVLIILTE